MTAALEPPVPNSIDPEHGRRHYDSGIEVVHSEYDPESGPQARPAEADGYVYPTQHVQQDEGLEVSHNQSVPDEIPLDQTADSRSGIAPLEKTNKKRTLLFLGIAILLVVGAVVGGVVGTQVKKARGGRTSPDITTPTSMVGSPTSVSPGLAPTAVSWGYPHLEVFALTMNNTAAVYRKWRNSNATSESDSTPQGRDMELVGGHVDTTVAPSISLAWYLYTSGEGNTQNATSVHIYDMVYKTGLYKFHDEAQLFTPWGNVPKEKLYYWDIWENIERPHKTNYLSAPTCAQYDKTVDMVKVFFISPKSTGSTVCYFQFTSTSHWEGPFPIYGQDLHEWAPAVIAPEGNDTRLDVFAVSRQNNHLLHTHFEAETNQWAAYEDLKGFLTVPPTVVSPSPGRFEVFTRGGDGGLWQLTFDDGKWSDWHLISGTIRIQGQPHAVASNASSIDVFVWGEARGEMLYKTYDSTTQRWSPDNDGFTTLISSGLVGPPSALVYGSDVHVFAYNSQNQIVWQTIGSDKKASGDAKAWADVPYNVA
ncbi:hypothetical protein PG991_012348 [Apiospora marii]|uniref:PLL-like beta propeller domain-containing protein n=1 Tax=Apiospora marii TaxID=335849 RepID=A0ABR1R9K1_9PEZI